MLGFSKSRHSIVMNLTIERKQILLAFSVTCMLVLLVCNKYFVLEENLRHNREQRELEWLAITRDGYRTIDNNQWYHDYGSNEDRSRRGDHGDHLRNTDICLGSDGIWSRKNCPEPPECSRVDTERRLGPAKLCINRVPFWDDRDTFFVGAMKCIPEFENCDKCICGQITDESRRGYCYFEGARQTPDDDRTAIGCGQNRLKAIRFTNNRFQVEQDPIIMGKNDNYHGALQASTKPTSAMQFVNIDNAQRLWESMDIQTYIYLYTRESTVMEVEVVDDVVIGAVPQNRGSTAINDYGQIPDILDLFVLIREALEEEAASLEVEYNETIGYPSRIFIDYDDEVVGEEVTILVESLTEKPSGCHPPFISEIYARFDPITYTVGVRDNDHVKLYEDALLYEKGEKTAFHFGDDGLIRIAEWDNGFDVTDNCLQVGQGNSIAEGMKIRVKQCNDEIAAQQFVLEGGDACNGERLSIALESNRSLHVVYNGSPQPDARIIVKDQSHLGGKKIMPWKFH